MYETKKAQYSFEQAKEIALEYRSNLDYYSETEKAFIFGASEERMMFGPAPIVVMKDPSYGRVFTMHDAPDYGEDITPAKYFNGEPLEKLF